MTARRLSHLQKQILAWLWRDEQRTRGMIASSPPELVARSPLPKAISATACVCWKPGGGSSSAAPQVGKRNPCTSRGRVASRRSNWREVMNKQ